MRRSIVVFAISLWLVFGPALLARAQAPTVFKKLDFYTQDGEEMDDHDAQLIVDAQRRLFIFAEEDNDSRVFATVPWDRITGVTYENSKHARITAGLLVAWPMLFLSGKKHWLTMTFGPEPDGTPGGYVFARMDKDNFQTILAAVNGYTGYEIRRIEESGEISVLYPGTQGAPPATAANSGASPSTAAGGSGAVVDAGSLPPRSGGVPAGPLPPAPDERIAPLVLLNKGAQWTERTATAVAYSWAVEVGNENGVAVDSTVILQLFDAQGSVIHEARRNVNVPPNDVVAFTAEGEVAEAEALRADHWEFHLTAAEPTGVPPTSAAAPGSPPSAASSVGSTPTSTITPVPLTDDIVKPVLDTNSVMIVTDNPTLQQVNMNGARITIRCLIRADGRVEDARVFRIDPEITSEAMDADMKEAIKNSAVNYWRFSPALQDGVAVPVWHMVTLEYTPGDAPLP